MASLFTLRALIGLATKIGANPSKFLGTRTNITFLGKGPTKNPLFQSPLAGIENATVQNLGKREKIVDAVEDAMSYASSGKLNTIQREILGKNLLGIKNIYHPPVLPTLPTASVTPIRSGIKTVAPKPMTEIQRLLKKGYTDARGRRWDFGAQGTGAFQGWTPKVVPKAVNIPASKINHQMIADKYGIDVELIRGKDWIEVLEVIKNLGLRHGGLARILEV